MQDNKYNILSESDCFCRRCVKNIWFTIPIAVHLLNVTAKFHKVV